MDWKKFWDQRGNARDSFEQVARTRSISEEELDRIAEHIVEVLDIQPGHTVLDVCCGNGLLTSRLSGRCAQITGVDFSEVLIAHAADKFPQIEFVCADVLHLQTEPRLSDMIKQADRINLYFSFQYFETFDKGKSAVKNLLPFLKGKGKILLGDIPDSSRFFNYYDSPLRILQLIRQTLTDKNDMGKFWSAEELDVICRDLHVTGKKIRQPSWLPYAHYRMDYLITA